MGILEYSEGDHLFDAFTPPSQILRETSLCKTITYRKGKSCRDQNGLFISYSHIQKIYEAIYHLWLGTWHI